MPMLTNLERKSVAVCVGLLAVGVVAAGCGRSAASTPEVPAVEVTVSVAATTSVEEPTLPPAPDVSVEGISFSYDDALASDVLAETVPTLEYVDGDAIPEHVQFTFVGYPLQGTFHAPRIHVYPVAEFEASSQRAAMIIAEQRQFLAERPAVPVGGGFNTPGIPFLPLFNAAQVLRTQVAYLDFQSGAGVRFLTQYNQAFIPINNHEMFYTFQGLTHDGAHYVVAMLPVSHPMLPADSMGIPAGDPEAFANNFETYIADMGTQLDGQAPSSFTPNLVLLDGMMQSLAVQ